MARVQEHREKVVIESEQDVFIDIQNETNEELNFEIVQENHPKTLVIYITKN